MKRIALCAALLLATVSTTLPAFAVDKPATEKPTKAATEEARERFRRGVDLFRDGDYRAALIEFTRANEVAPNPKIQYNIAQTCLEMQDYACALHAFEQYLAEGGTDIPKDRRALSERELERVKKLVGYLKVTVNKDGAEVTIDENSAGKTPLPAPVLVGAGRHKVTVSLAPLPPQVRTVDVAGGDKLDVTVELTEPLSATVVAPVAPQARPSTPTIEPPLEPARRSRGPFWTGLVATGVLAAGTTVTGVLALSAKSDLDSTANRFPLSAGDLDSAQGKVRTLSTATDVLLVSTVVAAGVTTLLFFTTGTPSRGSSSARLANTLLTGAF